VLRTYVSLALMAAAVVLGLSGLAGCGKAVAPQKAAGAVSEDRQAEHAHAGHQHAPQSAADKEAEAEIAAEMAKLLPADRALAQKQKVCAVTGEPLGSMGVPVKVTVNGRTVFLCCDGCEDELKNNPGKYLTRLDQGKSK